MQPKYRKWIKLLVLFTGVFILTKTASILLPVVLATILAFLFYPLVNFMSKIRIGPAKYHLPESIVILITFISVFILFGGFLMVTFTPLFNEFNKFLVNLPELLQKIENITTLFNARTSSMNLPPSIRVLIDQVFTNTAAFSLNFVSRVAKSILSFAGQIVDLIVVPVLTYYFLKDWKTLKECVLTLFSPFYQPKARNLLMEMGATVSAYIRGQIILSIIMGIVVAVGLYVLRVEYPFVLGLLAMLTETIPIVGPIVGSVPAILIAYLVTPSLALKVIVFYLFVHQLENAVLVPNIMGTNVAIHPVIIIISLLIGGQLLGIMGMMLAVPVVAILKVLLRHLWFDEHS